MKVDAIVVGTGHTSGWLYAGVIDSSKNKTIWTCKHKHRSRHAAIDCAKTQLAIGERTLKRLWNPADDRRDP